MKAKRFVTSMVIFLVLVASISGCTTPEPQIVKETVVVKEEVEVPVEVEVEVPVEVTAVPEEPEEAGPVTLTLQRFFGDCADEYEGVTDPWKAHGECGAVQVLVNKWNAEHPEAQIEQTVAAWGDHYARLNAAIASGDPPDIVNIDAHVLSNYASRGVLLPLDDGFKAAGVPVDDFLPTAISEATYDGKMYALPFGISLNLWFINVDLFEEAGLVDDNGDPIIPQNREEFMAAAAQVKERTGKYFVTGQVSPAMNGGIWPLTALVRQQGGDYFTKDLETPTIDSPEVANAVDFFLEMIDKGYYPNDTDYGTAGQMWYNGESATHFDGTWCVDYYDGLVADGETVFSRFYVSSFPTIFEEPASFTLPHLWVLPASINRAPDLAKIEAAIEFLKFFNEHNIQWARTGHMTVRKSVMESAEFANLPHRSEYEEGALYARCYPDILEAEAFQAILSEELEAIFRGLKSREQGLADAQSRMEKFLSMSRR